jgi:hypothetical protein
LNPAQQHPFPRPSFPYAPSFPLRLPFYIRATPIAGKLLSPRAAGNLSTLFDVGGIVGGALAGHLSDSTGASAAVAAAFTVASVPALFLYRAFGHVSVGTNAGLMLVAGLLIAGPYALITTAVSADLGTHESLGGSAKVRRQRQRLACGRKGHWAGTAAASPRHWLHCICSRVSPPDPLAP